MGHTLGTVTQTYHRFLEYVKPFRRALRKSDQIILDSLLDEANQHLPASSYAANLLPGIGFLLSIILEKQKQMMHLATDLELLRRDFNEALQKQRIDHQLEISKLKTEIRYTQQKNKNGE